MKDTTKMLAAGRMPGSPTVGHYGRRQTGVSLIEVLIAVLIMGIGLLGMAAMQTTALRNSQSALARSQAVMHAYSILDAMRANADAAVIDEYDLALACTPPLDDGTLASKDLRTWFISMQEDMALGGNSCAAIDCGSDSCMVRITYDDRRGSGGDAAEPVVVETML